MPPPRPPDRPSLRYKPDRPRQLEERNPQPQHPPAPHRQPPTLKPYQLKPKRGQETFTGPPVEHKEVITKQIKCMKKKPGKLNRKISHSKKKHNNLVSNQNSIKKKIE